MKKKVFNRNHHLKIEFMFVLGRRDQYFLKASFILENNNNISSNTYSWVMTFDESFTEVTFWDPFDSQSYKMYNRVTEVEKLK